MMANPSDPEQSEDKEPGGDKSKPVTKPSAGLKQETKHDVNDSKCEDGDSFRRSETLSNDIYPESSMTNVEKDGNISYQQLPSTDLSVDARACSRPRQRKSKDVLSEKEKFEKSEPTKDFIKDCGDEGKKKEKSDKGDIRKINNREDIENLIKQLTEGKVSDIKFFDAAIVYAKYDFEYVVHFKQKLVDIAKTEFNENLRIELFDSEEFAQSKIMVIEDVLKRCSVVFVYLTSNFTSVELNLFIEEAIGISRLGLGNEQYSGQNPWVLKPVHTEPRKSRNYKTPVGLLTVNGIDWFDRHSLHTINNVIGVLKTAITQRKQREMEVNTSIGYNTLIGVPSEMPQLGPPFNKPHAPPRFQQHPVKQQYGPALDIMSFPVNSAPSQPLRVLPTNIRTDAQPSFLPGYQNVPYSYTGQFHSHQHGNNVCPPSDLTTQLGLGHSGYQMHPPPYSSIAPHPHFRQPEVPGQRIGQSLSALQPENVYHTSSGHGQRFVTNQTVGQLPNYRAEAMQQVQSSVPPTQIVGDVSQGPVYPPSNLDFQRQRSNDHYPSMYVSQDAFHSHSGSFQTGQMEDTLPSSRQSVNSQTSDDMISRTNLSADDDVEVDNSTKCNSDVDDRVRQSRHHDDSEESSAESDSDSDSDSDCYEGARVVEKVVKIYKCKNVQLGEGNVVKEIDKKPARKDHKLKKKPNIETRRKPDESLGNVTRTDMPQNVLSKTGMNISVSEDNMSMENVASGGTCDNVLSIYPSKTTLVRDNVSNKTHTSFASGNTNKLKPKAHLKMSVDNKGATREMSTVFSPDDNFTEDQLFGSGSLSSSGSVPATVEAPFSFSQGFQQTRDIRKLLLPLSIEKEKNPEQMLDNTSVNTEELD